MRLDLPAGKAHGGLFERHDLQTVCATTRRMQPRSAHGEPAMNNERRTPDASHPSFPSNPERDR